MTHEEYTIVKDELFLTFGILPILKYELVRLVLTDNTVVIGYVNPRTDRYSLWIDDISVVKQNPLKICKRTAEYKPNRISNLQIILSEYNDNIATVPLSSVELLETESVTYYCEDIFKENESYSITRVRTNILIKILEVFDDNRTLAIELTDGSFKDLSYMLHNVPETYDSEKTYVIHANDIKTDVEISSLCIDIKNMPKPISNEDIIFDFPTAIKYLLEGKKVCPKNWVDNHSDEYFIYDKDTCRIFNEKGIMLDIMQFSNLKEWKIVE